MPKPTSHVGAAWFGQGYDAHLFSPLKLYFFFFAWFFFLDIFAIFLRTIFVDLPLLGAVWLGLKLFSA